MPGINFSGLGSEIDFGLITDAIINQSSRPMSLLQSKKANINNRIGKLKELNGKLIALTSAAQALTTRTLGSGRISSSSDASVVTATSTDAASFNTTNLTITRLASNYTEASGGFASATAPLLNTDVNGDPIATSFKLKRAGTTDLATISLDATNNSLDGLRDAINNAASANGLGVSASVVFNGLQHQLVINSTSTGAAQSIQLVEEPPAPAADINFTTTTLNPGVTPGDYSALDALFSVNGLSVTRASNTVSDVATGVTFSLKKAGTASVTVAQNTSDLGAKVEAFVEAYNSLQDFVAAQYATNSEGKPMGALVGDPTLRNAQRMLRDAVGGQSTTNGGSFTNLTQLGIGRDEKGKLTLDSATLNTALKDSLGDVQALLFGKTSSDTGIANNIHAVANSLSDSLTGVVQSSINSYTSTVTSLDKSISRQQDLLDAMRASLSRNFAAVDAAIGQLKGQGSAISSILKTLEPKSDR